MASMDVPAGRAPVAKAVPATVVTPTYISRLTLAFMTTASRGEPAQRVNQLETDDTLKT